MNIKERVDEIANIFCLIEEVFVSVEIMEESLCNS